MNDTIYNFAYTLMIRSLHYVYVFQVEYLALIVRSKRISYSLLYTKHLNVPMGVVTAYVPWNHDYYMKITESCANRMTLRWNRMEHLYVFNILVDIFIFRIYYWSKWEVRFYVCNIKIIVCFVYFLYIIDMCFVIMNLCFHICLSSCLI